MYFICKKEKSILSNNINMLFFAGYWLVLFYMFLYTILWELQSLESSWTDCKIELERSLNNLQAYINQPRYIITANHTLASIDYPAVFNCSLWRKIILKFLWSLLMTSHISGVFREWKIPPNVLENVEKWTKDCFNVVVTT